MSGNSPRVETKRLVLRRFRIEDANALHPMLRDPAVNAFLPMFPPRDIGETRCFLLENFIDRYADPVGLRYAICNKATGEIVGYVKVSGEANDLGCALGKAFWNRGIATEACRAVVFEAEKPDFRF